MVTSVLIGIQIYEFIIGQCFQTSKSHDADVYDLIEQNTFFLIIFVRHIYFDSQQICQDLDAK